MLDHDKLLKAWIRSQHLICEGSDFIFETVDQSQLEKYESCLQAIGGRIRASKPLGTGLWGRIALSKF